MADFPRSVVNRFRGLSGRRSTRLTSEGTRFLLFALAVGIAAINTGNNLFYLLLAMMLSVIMLSGLLSELCLRGLVFRRHVPDYIFANEPVRASITISNQKAYLPSFSIRIFDVVNGQEIDREAHLAELAPQASTLATYTIQAARRGRYCLQGVRAATLFPFGLFQKKALYPDETTIVVCPELIPLPSPILQNLTALGRNQALMRRGPGMALYNLREYRPGDDSRAIHWMTTARTSKLMLKETEAEDLRAVTLLLSTIAPAVDDAAFEQAVSVTAALATFFHECGYVLRAVIGQEEIPAATGAEQYVRILRALASCERQDPGVSPSNRVRPYLASEAADPGIVLAVLPWTPKGTLMNCPHEADCIITTTNQGLPAYAARPGLFS
ncbi:DUF58 domain-containing protein [Nitrospira sp. Nam80]